MKPDIQIIGTLKLGNVSQVLPLALEAIGLVELMYSIVFLIT